MGGFNEGSLASRGFGDDLPVDFHVPLVVLEPRPVTPYFVDRVDVSSDKVRAVVECRVVLLDQDRHLQGIVIEGGRLRSSKEHGFARVDFELRVTKVAGAVLGVRANRSPVVAIPESELNQPIALSRLLSVLDDKLRENDLVRANCEGRQGGEKHHRQ